ncbi:MULTISPECIES: J domain-containing protein [Spirulina sp. CCY15215]|uniref:J domain-containing protein n=1 Tax=Spirulina sp. CCY15215 TaxID=2767591 RepID=UPI00194F4F2B|nr:J domain-containing protein [Spirulina major]
MTDRKTYYEILNIFPNATSKEIKTAFRHLARLYHPDFNPNNSEASEQFKQILAAYEVLCDRQQRQNYDRQLGVPPEAEKKQQESEWDFYLQGIEKAIQKDYQGAIASYNQAINLSPRFLEAYLKRGEIYYTLKDDRLVLGNCRQILQFFPNCAEAYYYQGRSRYRLGYIQSSIESYDRAISCDPHFATAYYYRGVANRDLQEHFTAEQNLEQAATLFQEQGDRSGYQLAQETLSRLDEKDYQGEFNQELSEIQHLILAAWEIIINPSQGGINAYSNLPAREAIALSLFCAAIANIAFLVGIDWGWQKLLGLSSFLFIFVGIIPFISLALFGFLLRFLFRISGDFAADIFVAGITLIPLGFLAVMSGIATHFGGEVMVILTLFTSSHLILTLYHGMVKISGFPEAIAAWCVPVLLLSSGWLTFIGFQLLNLI